MKKYREYYSVKGIFENALYDGIADLLADLRAAGRVVSLATSKPEPFALRILEHFGIAGVFDHVAGAELTGPRNSKTSVLRYACGLCNVADMESCLMVGDREYDVLAGCMGGLLARMLPQPQAPQYAAAETDTAAATVLQPAHMLAGQAVALHALAGKSLAGQWPLRGNTPSAVADALPAALAAYTATPAPEDDFLPWPR